MLKSQALLLSYWGYVNYIIFEDEEVISIRRCVRSVSKLDEICWHYGNFS